MNRGLELDTTPRPIWVLIASAPAASVRARKISVAPEATTPPPATNSGRLAEPISLTALATAEGSAPCRPEGT